MTEGMTDLLALFTQAAKLLREATDEAMSHHGVRVGQHIVLSVLWEEDGLTPGEVARRLEVATPTIVNTATRMEEAGLLVRRPDPDDARLVRLYLTPYARSVRDEVRDARAGLERRVTANLDPAELDHLRSALTKIIAQLRDGPAGGLCHRPEAKGDALTPGSFMIVAQVRARLASSGSDLVTRWAGLAGR
jgi:MarR family transcriptional regulator, organic hydroperoxide resistance regulator